MGHNFDCQGSNFGGSYRFPLDCSTPMEMPVFQEAGTSTIDREHSFWWRSSEATPFILLGERRLHLVIHSLTVK